MFNEKDMKDSLSDFLKLYESRPVRPNHGGMGINHSWALWFIVSSLKPKIIIESGVWRGHSTWIIEKACPVSKIYSFDLDFSKLEYRSPNAQYFENDFSEFDWSKIDVSNSLCLFDDHQNSLERAKTAKWFGFKRMIFEDNWPVGQGDSYSLKHMKEKVGMPRMQMSDNSRGSIFRRSKTALIEYFLQFIYLNQTLIRKPNSYDFANFLKNIEFEYEVPPLYLNEKSQWGNKYTDKYKAKLPLLKLSPAPDYNYDYSFITYIELK
jgi:hypothetical protein